MSARPGPVDSSRSSATLRALLTVLPAYVAIGGGISFLGWLIDRPALTDWDADAISIQPNAALAAVIAGLAIACLLWDRVFAALTLGVVVALLGGGTLFEHLTGIALGIDDLFLFGRSWGDSAVVAPGRMGLPASSSWLLLGVGITCAAASERDRGAARAWAVGLALITAAIAGLSLLGYLYGASRLYSIPTLTAVALQTASFLFVASIALLAAVPERGPMRLLRESGPSGALARRLLPALIVLPVLLGLGRIAGSEAELYDDRFGTSLRTLAEIVLMSLVMWWSTRALRSQDRLRLEAAAALAEREGALSEAQRVAQVGSWSWDAATDAITASAELHRLFGVPADVAFPSGRAQKDSIYPPQSWSALESAGRTCLETGVGFQLELEAVRAGTPFWVSVRCEPSYDTSGRFIGMRGTAQDISARVESQAQRRRHEELLRTVTEHAQVGLVVVDRDHRYVYANPAFARLLERRLEEIVGFRVSEVFGDEHAAGVGERLERAFAGHRVQYEVAIALGGPERPVRWFSASYEPLADEAGRVMSVVVALVDVTARHEIETTQERIFERERHARAEAERAVRIKDEFLATLSHELRTPLNAVLGWAQVLRLSPGDPEKVRSAAEVIERNGRLQAQLITDLLDMSRIMSGKMLLEVQPVDLAVAVGAAIESMSPAARAKNITIERVIEPIHSLSDPVRLQQIVWNLLSNAVKFTPSGGKVRVELARADEHVVIRVIDSGRGVPAEFLPVMFERFRQADSSTTRSQGGLGIGLALVKQLVELHGGSIRASSAGEGRGAEFEVLLPYQPEGSSGGGVVADEKSAVSLKGASILVVDDEPDGLAVVRRLLESREAEVVTAESPEEALPQFEVRTFDLVISDIGMPHMDGHAFLRTLRARGVSTPALALSAFARDMDKSECAASGFQLHVSKPMDAAELLRAVQELVGSRSRID